MNNFKLYAGAGAALLVAVLVFALIGNIKQDAKNQVVQEQTKVVMEKTQEDVQNVSVAITEANKVTKEVQKKVSKKEAEIKGKKESGEPVSIQAEQDAFFDCVEAISEGELCKD